jgi:hypothetical protein
MNGLGYVAAMQRLLLAFGAALGLLASGSVAFGAGMYVGATTGNDVGYVQCGGSLPTSSAFGIVGVTRGRAFTHNACVGAEFSWAAAAPAAPSLYMNINAAVGSTASNGNTGPAGTCRSGDKACKNYNYGYKAAQDAFDYAASQGVAASTWWLDVETANSWLTQTAINDQVINGAIDFFHARSLTVGVYSTNYQWGKIAGSFRPGVPVWYATGGSAEAAPGFCSSIYDFAGGGVWLVQYAGTFDTDYACP